MADIHKIVRPFVPFQIGITTVVAKPRKTTQDNITHEVGSGGGGGQGGGWSYSASASGYADQKQTEVEAAES